MLKTEKRKKKSKLSSYPWNAPGISPPGSDFIQYARKLGDEKSEYSKKKDEIRYVVGEELRELYERSLREPGFVVPVECKNGLRKPATFITGHIWGQHAELFRESQWNSAIDCPLVDGPHRSKVMVIGKMPGRDELQNLRNFVGDSGRILHDMLHRLKAKGFWDWYVTNLVKFPPPDGSSSLRKNWINACRPLLDQELRLVRPDYILCLGSDASNALLGDRHGVKAMEGRVVDYKYLLNRTQDDEEPRWHIAKVMTVLHPVNVARDESNQRILMRGLGRFINLTEGHQFSEVEEGIDHRVCTSLEEAEEILHEAHLYVNTQQRKIVAWDAEWHGQHPINKGAYLRTIQMSWKGKSAVCFKLYDQGGERIAFRDKNGKPAIKRLMKKLTEFMKGKYAVGHFLVADLEWLEHYGFNLLPSFEVPYEGRDGKEAWQLLMEGEGGLDTGMMAHAIEETALLGLETLTSRYTDVFRYDLKLDEWKEQYCKDNGIKVGAMEGYGDCPDDVLIPYANYDADATMRLCEELIKYLDIDYDGNNCWEAFWESMIVQPVILEIHQTGMVVDRERVDMLTMNFITARSSLEDTIKKSAKWERFNIRSVQHVREYLYGEELNGKVVKGLGSRRIRPEGAKTLLVQPILTTDKPPKRWDELVALGKEMEHSPSTNKDTLAILALENAHVFNEINAIRDYRFLDQVLKSILRPPELDSQGMYRIEEDGHFLYEKGLAGCIDFDGRVRTHLSPTAETGRWKSARPNLQNISKTRDPDYARLLGDENYKHKLRSLLQASPDKIFVEFDFKGAELYGTAIMAGDKLMIDHCKRNQLPDEGFDEKGDKVPKGKHPHPDYYDIHSNIAVMSFKLCVPEGGITKEDLAKSFGVPVGTPYSQVLRLNPGDLLPANKSAFKLVGKGHLRNVAKCVMAGSRLHTTGGLIRVESLVGNLKSEEGAKYAGDLSVVNHKATTEIVGIYNGGIKPCVAVETEQGYRLESSTEHFYWVVGSAGEMEFKHAKHLKKGDWLAVRMDYGPFGNNIGFPVPELQTRTSNKSIDFPSQFNEDWAAFIGLYLSEGNANPDSGMFQLCLADAENDEFAEATTSLLKRMFDSRVKITSVEHETNQNQKRFVINSTDLCRTLASWDLGTNSVNYRLPDFVFQWPEHLIRSLLKWMFEGDGSVKKNDKGFSVCYSTASEELVRQIQLLLSIFGIASDVNYETRKGYENKYWTLRIYSSKSRHLFVERIGFVTNWKNNRCQDNNGYVHDRFVIPNQVDRLRILLPYVRGLAKEKCRECVRENKRVELNPTRLKLILDALENELPDKISKAADSFREILSWPVFFSKVETVTDLGNKQIYDVQTTSEYGHLVSYNGLLNHQTIIFGLLYGRGAKAIAIAAKAQKTEISVDEAQQVIDTVYSTYPKLRAFFDECGDKATNQGWMCHCFGRFRRFPPVMDYKMEGEFERQAMNFPIQGMIASALDRGIASLRHERNKLRKKYGEDIFKFVLTIHDAVLIETKPKWVHMLAKKGGLIERTMCDAHPIYPTNLDGIPTGKGPFILGTDVTLHEHWGEEIKKPRCQELGIPVEYGKD